VLVIVVAALVWNFLPLSVTAGWVAAVTARRPAADRVAVCACAGGPVDPEEALRGHPA